MAGFGKVDLKIRPLRLGHLIEPNNKEHLTQAMTISSTLWGGMNFPIITLYKRMPQTWTDGPLKPPKAKDVILGYIDAYDPDVLINFSKEAPDYISDLGIEIIRPEEIWETLDEGRYLSPKFGIGIFEIFDKLFDDHFKFKAKYPITISIPTPPDRHKLFWSSFLGCIPKKVSDLIEKYYEESLDIGRNEFDPSTINDLLKVNNFFPRRFVQYNLEHIRQSGGRRGAYAFFLDATKYEDIVDYWNLRATGRTVLPLPKQYLSNEPFRKLTIKFFKDSRKPWGHDKKHCDYASIVRSRNSTIEEIQEFVANLDLNPDPKDPSQDPYYSIQRWYPRIWDEWARDKDGIIPDDFYGDEESIEISESDGFEINFNPLMPKFAARLAYYGEPRCVNEVSFRFYGADEYLAEIFPKESGKNLLKSISSSNFRNSWRIGRHGLVKLVANTYPERWTIPESEKVMFAWLKDRGWEPNLSAPGLLAKQIYKKLGGHINALENKKLLGLLEHMNGGHVNADGKPSKNDGINQERPLSIGEIKLRLKDSSQQKDFVNYLVEKGVFHTGIKIQCPHCVRKSWYAINNISDTIECPRCLNKYPAIGNIERGDWCYKTAGPFSVPNYADGAFATLLALNFFNDLKLNTFQATPALNFTAKLADDPKTDIEADFALFWQDSIYGEKVGGILFAECKTYGEFKQKDFSRMKLLAKKFPGAVIAFTTLRNKLTDEEISGITKIAKTGRKYWRSERPINPVLILTETELLDRYGPPYCWEKNPNEHKYFNVHGLISVCDFTQQRYLNLPSWNEEWIKGWEKKGS